MARPRTYAIDDIADLLEEAFGDRPSAWAIRHAQFSVRRATSTQHRGRLTEGLPAPVENPASPPEPAQWDQAAVDAWIQNHPLKIREHRYSELKTAAADGDDLDPVISRALDAGLSWRRIAAAVREGTGVQLTHEGIRKAYQRRQRN